MSWLILTISAYFFLSIVALFDRYFLVGKIPNPKVYTFFVGILWFLLCLIFIPFGISVPETNIIILGLGVGLVRILATLFLTEGIVRSEISRMIPAVGGFLPIFSFLLFFVYFPRSESLNLSQFSAFVLLVFGSIMISLKNSLKIFNLESLKYPVISAFLFALNFFLMKILFLKTNFLNGLFLTLLGGGVGAIFLFGFSDVRKSIFNQKISTKISGIFILGQTFGGLGVISQFYAVSLARPGQVPLINATEGIRYVFLLLFVLILSFWKPKLLKEETKGTILLQKIIAVLLIGAGLYLLILK